MEEARGGGGGGGCGVRGREDGGGEAQIYGMSKA